MLEDAIDVKKQLNELEGLAKLINPNFVFSDDWLKRVEKIEDCAGFLALSCKVLKTEIDQGFYDKAHHEQTLSEQNYLSQQLSCLLAELFGEIYTERLPLIGNSGFLGDFSIERIKEITQEIIDKGYYIWPEIMSHEIVERLSDELKDKKYKNRMTGKEITGKQATELRDKLKGTWWVENDHDLPAKEALQNVALDPAILAVAQNFLGTVPIHVQTNSWWTFPPPASANTQDRLARLENKNAQRFHQDQEFITFIKVFIYLTDVDENSGPHVYVEGSANDYEDKLPTKISSTRRTDNDIYKAFGKDRVKSITGRKGQITFVNTRGFHRGSSVKEGNRLLLQLEYASSLYFNPVDSFDVTCLSTENKLLMREIPRIFMNYRYPEKIDRKSSSGLLRQARQKLSYLRGRIEELIT